MGAHGLARWTVAVLVLAAGTSTAPWAAAGTLVETVLAAETFREARVQGTPVPGVGGPIAVAPPGPVACEAVPAWEVPDTVVGAVVSVVEAVGAEREAAAECVVAGGGSGRNV